MRAIRASDLGSYRFCERAWWYQLQGVESDNLTDLAAGSSYHQSHGRRTLSAGLMRAAGWLLLLGGLVTLVVWLTSQAIK
ncbi:MAG TPA: hypothetical protein PLT26_02235 [Anaerolineaceae bacterium]|nr:hypothetical protein [Anaerolineaceae bacterium]HQH84697.1 hypothetical protein [Anaerolineaceae bacterium]